MKKLSTVALVIVFVASAFTFSAFAAETTFTGTYRIRAYNEFNFDKKLEDTRAIFPGHDNAQHDGWFDQRFRLVITHKRSEYLKAVIRIDIVEDTWGQQRNLRMNDSAANFSPRAYLEFTFPKIGTFTVGKFSETYGHGLAFSDSGSGTISLTGARWVNAWGPISVSVLYAKVADRVTIGSNNPEYNWDANLYAMNLKITLIENNLVELFGGYLQDNDSDGASGLGGILRNSWAWNSNGVGAYSADIGFVGIAYTGTIADMIEIMFENSYIFGLANPHVVPPTMTVVGRSTTIQGWNIYADVSYYNNLLRVGAAFIMGSGQHHFWGINQYQNLNMNYISQDNFVLSNILVGGGGGDNSIWWDGSFGQDNIENITAIKLYFAINPIEKLTLTTSVTWAKWTEKVGRNTLGTRATLVTSKGSAYRHPAAAYGNYNYQSWDTSDDLGWEIDFGFSYEIMEGLTYSFNMGVLFTGDSWDYERADGTRGDWGEIWSITNALTYTF